MKRREFLMATTFLTIALVSATGRPAGLRKDACGDEQVPASEVEIKVAVEVGPIEPLWVEPSPLISKDKTLAAAYFNTVSILGKDNDCSRFFGGPRVAIEVFQQLISKVQKVSLATPVGIQMSGETVNVTNAFSNARYRTFDKVRINSDGPFYRRQFSRSNTPMPRIANFEPNTKEVRVLMFLHELGHIMKGEDGQWLLPNDGKDEALSRQNSQKINDVCGEQIKALGKGDHQMTLAGKTTSAASEKH